MGAALGPQALVGTSITVRDRDYKIPYVYLFQGGFQYELPFKALLEASYVGSRTHRIAITQKSARTVAGNCGDNSAANLTNYVVRGVGDVDIVARIDEDAVREIELGAGRRSAVAAVSTGTMDAGEGVDHA